MLSSKITRRRFVHHCAACSAGMAILPTAALASLKAPLFSPAINAEKAKVSVIFAHPDPDYPNWPNIGYDFEGKIRQAKKMLIKNCPDIEFNFISTMDGSAEEGTRIIKQTGNADGYAIYLVGCLWGNLTETIATHGKPTVMIDHLYAGSGEFLTSFARVRREGHKVVAVSSSDDQDIIKSMRLLSTLKKLQQSRMLVVGNSADKGINEVYGTDVVGMSFEPLKNAYEQINPEDARKQARIWTKEANRVIEPSKDDIYEGARMYLAMHKLINDHHAQAITVNCLGGIYSGQLPVAYPCLGFMALDDQGLVGACEADQRSTLTKMLMTYLVGRPGFISDPVIDTSKNQIIYAHCIAPTKVYGPDGTKNPFDLRSHSEDRKGACNRSLMPLGDMTTTIQFDHSKKKVIFHQGIAVENVDDDRACRNKLAIEVKGDIHKLLNEWDQWGWHRVTFFGDFKREVYDISRLLGFEVQEEA
ncbi:MAG: hypothetical protein U9N86_06065 [Bacteroidota bacterium]|nr:hypothetical protein [Bacteroidota bacterium]